MKMDKKIILDLLKENELSDIEELQYKDDVLVVRFYYDFDETEIKAAKAFADDESGEEEQNEIWTEEFFLPYLTDLAIDNVGEYIEEIMEQAKVSSQYMSYDLNIEETDYCEFIAVFYEGENEIEIETVLDELKL